MYGVTVLNQFFILRPKSYCRQRSYVHFVGPSVGGYFVIGVVRPVKPLSHDAISIRCDYIDSSSLTCHTRGGPTSNHRVVNSHQSRKRHKTRLVLVATRSRGQSNSAFLASRIDHVQFHAPWQFVAATWITRSEYVVRWSEFIRRYVVVAGSRLKWQGLNVVCPFAIVYFVAPTTRLFRTIITYYPWRFVLVLINNHFFWTLNIYHTLKRKYPTYIYNRRRIIYGGEENQSYTFCARLIIIKDNCNQLWNTHFVYLIRLLPVAAISV